MLVGFGKMLGGWCWMWLRVLDGWECWEDIAPNQRFSGTTDGGSIDGNW